MSKTTSSTGRVAGVFQTRAEAERAVADLKAAGYRDDQIDVIAKNADGETVRKDGGGETHAGEGAAIGAGIGAGAAALTSLGIAFGVIPVIGPVLAVGPLAAALISAAGGALAGGLAGGLVGWGIPEEDAKFYEAEVTAGRYLVTVEGGAKAADARGIYARHGGYDRATAGKTLELHEERLKTSKQTVKTGEVDVRKEVHTEHKQITVPVQREEVVIERRAVGGAAAAGSIHAEEIRIPVSEERVNVSKETVVKEEVKVGKRTVQGTETVEGDVRHEELEVESEGDVKVRQSDRPGKR